MTSMTVEWKLGDEPFVFDCDAWRSVGHDVGDNSCFWRKATILEVYARDRRDLADVRFHGDGRISRGHFVFNFLRHKTKERSKS